MDPVTLGAAKADAAKRRFRANSIVWLGDSHTANGGGYTTPGVSADYNSIGFWCHAQSLLGHRLQNLKNAGVAGERTDQVLARVQSQVIALNPGWCHVLAGTNDITQAVALATIKANLTAIWDALDRQGIRVIAGTIPPRSTYSGSQLADTLALNTWILDQGRQRRNLVVVDYFSQLATQGGTAYAGGMTTDGLHPSASGASYMGLALAAVLAPLVPANPSLLGVHGGNLLPNGAIAAGGAGSVPTGWLWNGTPAPTYSRVARTDGRANLQGAGWQRIVQANGNSGSFQTNTSGMTGMSVGDLVVGTIEYRATSLDQAASANTQYLYLRLGQYNGSTFTAYNYDLYWQPGYGNHSPFDRSGVLRTPPMVVASGTTQIAMFVMIGGGGTFDFAGAGLFNLTTQGLTV